MAGELIKWRIEEFGDLSKLEVYHMLALRESIFVVEQDCPYQEIDGQDPNCLHLIGKTREGDIIATARIVPAGVIYSNCSIGRVAVHKGWRGKGLGHEVMNRCHQFVREQFGPVKVKIAAQQYLEKFYQEHGYETQGEPYIWDGISHVDMTLQL